MYHVHVDALERRALVGRSVVCPIDERSGARLFNEVVVAFPTGHAPGQVHESAETVCYCVSGEGAFWIAGVPYALRPGAVAHAPPRTEHHVEATSAEPLVLIAFSSPPVAPGSAPDLQPRSHDLPGPRRERGDFVRYVAELPHVDRGGVTLVPLLRTERLRVELLRLVAGAGAHLGTTLGEERVVHVLSGRGLVAGDREVHGGSVLLLRNGEATNLHADAELAALTCVAPPGTA